MKPSHFPYIVMVSLTVISIGLGIYITGITRAALTLDSGSLISDADITLNAAPSGTITLGSTTTTGTISVGSASAQNVSLTDNSWSIDNVGKAIFSFLDLGSAAHGTTALQGLRLPQAAGGPSANPASGEGYLAYDSTANTVKVYNGSSWASVGGTTAGGILDAIGYGDGSEGDATIDTNGTTTLTRDMMYGNLTVTAGDTLNTAGYRVYATGTIMIAATGKISADGNVSNSFEGGSASASAKCGSSGVGGGGGDGGGGSGSAATGLGGSGGAGAAGSVGAGGAGGAVTSVTAPTAQSLLAKCTGILTSSTSGIAGGAGGGGGGGSGYGAGNGKGGGGGGGGGTLVVVAGIAIANSGTLSAKGGAGSVTNQPGANSTGGGGGGGGGVIILIAPSITLGTTDVTGGAGGTGTGGGATGTAGSPGTVIYGSPTSLTTL